MAAAEKLTDWLIDGRLIGKCGQRATGDAHKTIVPSQNTLAGITQVYVTFYVDLYVPCCLRYNVFTCQ